MNRLYYGDNLDLLRDAKTFPDGSIDLIYLDPPFNSDRTYNVLFKPRNDNETNSQIVAFEDSWTWGQDDEVLLRQLQETATQPVVDALTGMYKLLGKSDLMSYIVMMAARLIELRRVLKKSGSIYLHCDPVASHYLKIICDAIFGVLNFRNEITWQRTFSHGNVGRNYGSISDIILFYAGDGYTWNQQFAGYSEEYVRKYFRYSDDKGRFRTVTLRNPSVRPNLHYPYTASNGVTYMPHPNGWSCNEIRMKQYDDNGLLYFPKKEDGALMLKQYLDSKEGVKLQNIWTDIPPIGAKAAERLGYPTQKPVALLERIVATSSNPGDIVMDPFCGCGTTIDAAERLGRQWIGIDISYLSIDVIENRLETTHPERVGTWETLGIPRDVGSAQKLFERNEFEFERWAVSLVDGHPNAKQVGDKGSDGVIRFWETQEEQGEVTISVKGGQQINPGFVRDLAGTVLRRKAAMGLLILLRPPTRGMVEEANHSGTYTHPLTGQMYPVLQIVTIEELLAGRRPQMPTANNPYAVAPKFTPPPAKLPGM